ncbi:glycosyltransferase family 2 protein [Nocardioides immobilis]|uniref:glycosyltransferase family 2 protein n=1 Tax=Nocardioides immobilis TaxID=2049295 RepID=UPI0015F96007|nr:glycosyltransferase family 2 protein [Nocardioides immobilis]
MTRPGPDQPRVRANDWRTLAPAELGRWVPDLSVTVVVPAHDPVHLDRVLAALAAQTYPAHLLEVVVVDDGSTPPVSLPEVRPEHSRVELLSTGWGRAAACQLGVDRSEGDVLHWLDSDVVPVRHEVEAHLRWHHLVDYAVILGRKFFAADNALDHLSPAELRRTIADGADPVELARGEVHHHWAEDVESETAGLAEAGARAMRMHVGMSGSVSRALYEDSAGMPVDLVLGEDIVLGYRLREAGAVFIPDPDARCLHLGESGVRRAADDVNRYNKPFIMQKVPEFRGHRHQLGRSYEVPYLEVVLPVTGQTYESVRLVVDAFLAGAVPDLVVTLTAEWGRLTEDRRLVLSDDDLELRLVRAAYTAEPRVRMPIAPASRSEATFRITLPRVERVPVGRALPRLLRTMEEDQFGVVEVVDDGRTVASVVRTAAEARARRTSADAATRAAALDEVYPTLRVTAEEAGFVPPDDVPPVKQVRGLAP